MPSSRQSAAYAVATCILLAFGACQEPTRAHQAPKPNAYIAGVNGFTQVSAGGNHACGILADKSVTCWGSNSFGQATVPVGIGTVTQISAGLNHTCARIADGSVTCWGDNQYAQSAVPPGIAGVTQVGAGEWHTCAVLTDKSITCWGTSYEGETVVPTGLSSASQVGAGEELTCALLTEGTVTCWGGNSVNETTVPSGLTGVVQLTVGALHACALKSDGTVICWGWNGTGQTSVPPSLLGVTQVSAGVFHTCAVTNSGSVVCWGEGSGISGESIVPTGLTGVTQVSAGFEQSCATAGSGTVTCWGANSTTPPSLLPAHVLPTATFSAPTSVSVGNAFSLALNSAAAPGYNGTPTFTFAFDCGDGSGYGMTGSAASRSCPTLTAGVRTAKGKVIDQAGDFSEYSASVTVSAAPGATVSGTNIAVTPVDPSTGLTPVTLTFASVTAPGTTTITSSGTGAPSPAGFKMGSPPVYYELQSTATFAGAVSVCFSYTPSAFHNPSNLRLFHGGSSGGWTDVTTSNDPTAGIICGSVTSFSPFILAELRYDFTGFMQPVDNPGNTGVVNALKAGSAVPVKFSLGGNLGLDVLAPNSPTSSAYTCTGTTEDAIEVTVTAGASSLTFDPTAGQYVYVWKTDKTWGGACRKLTVTLKDGTLHQALFKFSK